MIFKKKHEILYWLKIYDYQYEKNIKNNAYELIDIHNDDNKILLKEMIIRDKISDDYFDTLRSDGHQYILNVKASVDISLKQLNEIPIQFYHIAEDFACVRNQLQSLKGCPEYVGSSFYCYGNELESLQHGPQYVQNDFYCDDNKLSSLQYCPYFIGGYFDCSHNCITSLHYFPQIVHHQKVSLHGNEGLLKYKNKCVDMSDLEFLNQKNFSFWYECHLEENNQNIIEILEINFLKNKINKI